MHHRDRRDRSGHLGEPGIHPDEHRQDRRDVRGIHRDEHRQDRRDGRSDRRGGARSWYQDERRGPADEHYRAAAEWDGRLPTRDDHHYRAAAEWGDRTRRSVVLAAGRSGVSAPPLQRDVVRPERSALTPAAAMGAQRRRTRFVGTPERTSAQVPLMMKSMMMIATEPAGGCWR